MKRCSGPASFPFLGLVDASTLPAPVRSAPLRIVVRHVDGTHMGVALTWWRSLITGDDGALAAIRATCPPSDALRSGLEMVLGQADWIGKLRPDVNTASQVLSELAGDHIVTAEHQYLCRELAGRLDIDRDAVDFSITPIPVSSLMGLVAFLGDALAYHHRIPVAAQLAAYQRAVVLSGAFE